MSDVQREDLPLERLGFSQEEQSERALRDSLQANFETAFFEAAKACNLDSIDTVLIDGKIDDSIKREVLCSARLSPLVDRAFEACFGHPNEHDRGGLAELLCTHGSVSRASVVAGLSKSYAAPTIEVEDIGVEGEIYHFPRSGTIVEPRDGSSKSVLQIYGLTAEEQRSPEFQKGIEKTIHYQIQQSLWYKEDQKKDPRDRRYDSSPVDLEPLDDLLRQVEITEIVSGSARIQALLPQFARLILSDVRHFQADLYISLYEKVRDRLKLSDSFLQSEELRRTKRTMVSAFCVDLEDEDLTKEVESWVRSWYPGAEMLEYTLPAALRALRVTWAKRVDMSESELDCGVREAYSQAHRTGKPEVARALLAEFRRAWRGIPESEEEDGLDRVAGIKKLLGLEPVDIAIWSGKVDRETIGKLARKLPQDGAVRRELSCVLSDAVEHALNYSEYPLGTRLVDLLEGFPWIADEQPEWSVRANQRAESLIDELWTSKSQGRLLPELVALTKSTLLSDAQTLALVDRMISLYVEPSPQAIRDASQKEMLEKAEQEIWRRQSRRSSREEHPLAPKELAMQWAVGGEFFIFDAVKTVSEMLQAKGIKQERLEVQDLTKRCWRAAWELREEDFRIVTIEQVLPVSIQSLEQWSAEFAQEQLCAAANFVTRDQHEDRDISFNRACKALNGIHDPDSAPEWHGWREFFQGGYFENVKKSWEEADALSLEAPFLARIRTEKRFTNWAKTLDA